MEEFALSELTARHLVEKFGTCAGNVMALAKQDRELTHPLSEGLAALRAEVVYCARIEMAASVDDILARRIGVLLHGWNDAIRAAPVVAALLGHEWGWSESVKGEELAQYIQRIDSYMKIAGQGAET